MHELPTGVSRRQFLGRSACNAAGLAAGLVGLAASAKDGSPAETVRVGVVGVRRHGRKLALEFAAQPNTSVQAGCDIDGAVLDRSAADLAVVGLSPRLYDDYRRLLDDPQIDAIVVATPDHSHAAIALEAMAAGKDVYLESPVSHTIAEGDALVAAAQKSERVVQSGLFDRSLPHVINAIEHVRSGKIGSVPLVKAWAVHRRSPVTHIETFEAPARTDYAAWLAPAPERPFDPQRFHRNWNSFWDYGSGELGSSGVPLLDLAAWGLDVDLPQRVTAAGSKLGEGPSETPDSLQVVYAFPQVTLTWEHRQWSNHTPEGRSSGVAFYGTGGTLILDRGGWKVYDAADAVGENGRSDMSLHVADFLSAVRTRRTTRSPIETGVRAATLCHLGNIAYRLQREIRFNGVSRTFDGDDAANALMSATYRPGSACC